jgi:hypothetical protein
MRIILILLVSLTSLTHAETKNESQAKTLVKQKIKCNMTIKYTQLPEEVDTLKEFLGGGIFYGRLRLNSFIFNPKSVGEDHFAMGAGGSLIYKSAIFKGFSFTSGIYTTQNIWHSDIAPSTYRSGKDTFSRYNLATDGSYNLTTMPQNYIEYKKDKNSLKVGRFLINTTLLKSNDTKMIPNSFQGAYAQIGAVPKTKIEMAYITKQKLRDHESFHHVLAYGDNPNDEYAKWSENDDGGMHRGLTVSKLNEAGIDDKLLMLDIKNRTIRRTTLRLGVTSVPDLVSTLSLEGTYTFKAENQLKIKPSIRYVKQFDDGAGAIGGANLRNDTRGYSDPNSLESSLIATRVDFIKGAGSLRLGYSKIADQGDFVTPWRGFVTAGYSRAMGQTNWYANTETFLIRGDYDFSKANLVSGLRVMMRYAKEDFDDNKPAVSSDVDVFTMDIVKRFKAHPNFITKLRTAFVNQQNPVQNSDGSYKKDPSYHEVRLEMNYLF